MSLQKRVQLFLNQIEEGSRPFPSTGSRLLIGVSGGPDSLALLHVLRHIYPSHVLVVAHLHHGLRPSAGAEADFVAETAASWQVPCYIEKTDVTALARQERLSLEEAGRKARYRFFVQLAPVVDAAAVVVAHNADDQAETVLMHLLRGTGMAGLRGMLPVTTVPGAPALPLLRPFLTTGRDEIEAYCSQHNLNPVEDRSNKDVSFFRNRVRYELLPLLADYNPQIKTRLQQTATLLAADYDLLEALCREKWAEIVRVGTLDWLRIERKGWLDLPLSLRRCTLRRAVKQLRPSLRDVSFRPIEQARQVAEKGQTGAQATLPDGLFLTVGYQHLTVASNAAVVPVDLPQLSDETAVTPLPVPGRVRLCDRWVIESTLDEQIDLQTVATNTDPWLAFVDVEKISRLHIRPRQPGERFQPLGMEGKSAKIKDVMINRKIASHLRPRWPLVAMAQHLVWLVGHQIDERVRVTAASRRILRLHCYQIPAVIPPDEKQG